MNDAFLKSRGDAATLESNMAQAVAANKVKAQEAAATAEGKAQQLRQEGQLAAAQGLLTVAAQKQAAADRASATGAASRAADQANDRWYANFKASNERWIGEQGMQGQQTSQRNQLALYGMDPTLDRDKFGLDIENSWAGNNRGLLGIDAGLASGGGGTDWAKWAQLGLGAGGSALGGSNQDQRDYKYDSDDPSSIWYDPPGGINDRDPYPDPSEWD